jgi:hypothetical protein
MIIAPKFGSPTARWLAAALAALLLAACGGGGSRTEPEQPAAVARVQITPGSALLTGGAGATQQLSAQAFDASGDPVPATVTWSSSRPDQLAVGAGGLLTAQAAVGSAQITATAGGVSSAPMLALAATPAAGVVLVDDGNLVGDAVDSDPNAEPNADNTYQVTLTGLPAPALGTLMMGRGEKPLAGRVVATTPMGTQTLLTMQLVPLSELFTDLRIDEAIDLSRGAVELAPEVAARFDVVREGNTWRFTPKPGATTGSATRERRTSLSGTVDLLPFRDCKFTVADFSTPPVRVDSPSFTLTLSPALDARYSSATGLERLLVTARPEVSFGADLKATAKLAGDLKCRLQLLSFPVPIGGALSMFIGGRVPVGVGFEWSAATEFASFTAGARAEARADARAGIECIALGGCGFVHDITNDSFTVTPVVELPGFGDQRLASKLKVFGYLEGEFGSPLLRSLRFKAFEARVGGTLDGKFAPPVVQVLDAAFAADYKALLYGSAQVSTGIDALIRTLSLGSLRKLGLERDLPLATTPRLASAAADRASFAFGDAVNVSVQLDPATLNFLPGLYNVELVELRRASGSITLLVASQTASPGQSRFDFNVVAPHAGDVADWHVFVTTRLLPVELLGLELGRVGTSGQPTLVDRIAATAGECTASVDPGDDGPPGAFQRVEDSLPASCTADAGVARAQASVSGGTSGPALAIGDAVATTATLSFAASLVVDTGISVTGMIQRARAHARGGQTLGWTIQVHAETRVSATLGASSAGGGQVGAQVSVRAADGTLRAIHGTPGTHELTLLPGDRLAVGLGVQGEAATDVNPLPTDAPPLEAAASATASVVLRFLDP